MTYFVFFRYKIARRHFCFCGDRAFPFLLPKDNYKIARELSNTYQSAYLKKFLKKLIHIQTMIKASFVVCFGFGFFFFF